MLARFLSIVIAIILSAWTHGAQYQGPCDLVACAEAYSVTRAMTASYSGPLFQINNGSSNLDIGQTASHRADMTTWSAFCSGVASNCLISKIYAQIQGHANDLIPATFNAPNGPNCSVGTGLQCAAPFSIEAATGLPLIQTTAPQEYALSGDINTTGINGGSNSTSIVYNGRNIQTAYCCGLFGIAHKYNAGNLPGTDFMIALCYGTAGLCGPCQTATTFCIALDEEQAGGGNDQIDYGSVVKNVHGVITFNSGTNRVTAAVNNAQLLSNSPPASTINAGLAMHLGGGGDLSQPAPTYMREGMVINAALSTSQQTAIFNNVTAFYSALSFP